MAGPFREQREKLAANYIKRISELKTKYQETGNLPSSLKADTEIQFMERYGELSDQEFPDATAYRSIFSREQQSIDRQEDAAVVALHKRAVETLKLFVTESTKAGELGAAKDYGEQIAIHEREIARLQDIAAGKPMLKSFQIMSDAEADPILRKYDPGRNEAKTATPSASSSFSGHPASSVIRETRPNSLAEFGKADFWALGGSTGWLKLNWASPVKAKTLLLINRPVKSNGDFWVAAELSLNGQPILEIKEFGRMMVGVVQLEREIDLKELEIKIT
ncbi:MAG: hypothetical protein KDM63_07550 [Verrucomicrobiae bacterium]|nr:hypothetical protein [Verrucomicrobiae bacterium]